MAEGPEHDSGAVLVEFARELSGCGSVQEVLRHLGDSCLRLLPVSGVGVLLADDGDLTVATTNSELGEAAERAEVECGEGPCVEALRSGAFVPVPDLEASRERYPAFAAAALPVGVRSVHGIPLSGRGEMVGVLNIVHDEPLDLEAGQVAVAQMLADVAVSYILSVRMSEESTKLASQLQRALDTRVVIEQAKGMLAERHGEPLTKAFDRLRRHARGNNLTVRDVAAAVIDGSLRL